jgi:hypothetical protein
MFLISILNDLVITDVNEKHSGKIFVYGGAATVTMAAPRT